MKLSHSLLLLFLFLTASCSQSPLKRLKELKSWGYQLQNYELASPLSTVLKSPKRVWVLDPEFDKIGVSKDQIDEIYDLGGLPIAYLSIGEAENYRSYFKGLNKSLIVKENPNWKGNFKVKFWEAEWQKIIFNRIDDLMKLGFKGVYLDIVDAFYYFKDKKLRADEMVSFIRNIKKRGRSHDTDFIVIQQNAPTLHQYTSMSEVLFSNVDALALEDMFFFGDKLHDNAFLPQDYALKSAKLYIKKGKSVFNVEYLKDSKLIKKYKRALKGSGITPLVADRALNGYLLFSEAL